MSQVSVLVVNQAQSSPGGGNESLELITPVRSHQRRARAGMARL
jgi:hypothetical protein